MTKATNDGEEQFEHDTAEQLGKAKNLLTVMPNGVGDIALFTPSFASDKMPLTAALNCPACSTPHARAPRSLPSWLRPRSLARQESTLNGVRVLFAAVYSPHQLVSAKRSIARLKDVGSTKLCACSAVPWT